ncbi:hypothetical protein K9L27_03240 [Candidatus Gracilibacteria bacterium]|nr:hypothetical protein [Candidatus Gracilibacteria bacterium]
MKKFALATLFLTGIFHIVEAPEYFEEATYVGILFVLNFIGALYACWLIQKGKPSGWHLGMVISILSIAAFVISRSVGLPFFMGHIGEWMEEFAIMSVLTELLFLIPYVGFLRGKAK